MNAPTLFFLLLLLLLPRIFLRRKVLHRHPTGWLLHINYGKLKYWAVQIRREIETPRPARPVDACLPACLLSEVKRDERIEKRACHNVVTLSIAIVHPEDKPFDDLQQRRIGYDGEILPLSRSLLHFDTPLSKSQIKYRTSYVAIANFQIHTFCSRRPGAMVRLGGEEGSDGGRGVCLAAYIVIVKQKRNGSRFTPPLKQKREARKKKQQGRIEFLVLVMRAWTNADRDRASQQERYSMYLPENGHSTPPQTYS
ncbi:hypothetical protein P167DRAFT_567012 [Morchella conica CCBAS932]|uniref:Secreted protein n=1 Tax=Morchella conica CCBAS932 TaxID=1392247 RepID=A0A3N4KKL6_9PEZI|nr:hypothetical protein P167DRAFT_567012 [Morchella conica CCBAS932]